MFVNENKEMPQIDKSAFSERYIQRQHHQGRKEKMAQENATEEGETQSKEIKKKVKEKQQVFSNPIKELLQATNPKDQLQSHCTNTIIR